MKGKQGFQKGHGYLKKIGFKHTPETIEKMRIAHLGQPAWNKGLKGYMSAEKNVNWKGGLPKCLDCDKKVSLRKYIRCYACNTKFMTASNHPLFKGGYEQKLMRNKARRISKKGNGGSHTLDQWQQLKAKYDFMCLCCKQKEPLITLTEDHVVPISIGGTDNIENIQPLCQVCNSRKFTACIDFRITTDAII